MALEDLQSQDPVPSSDNETVPLRFLREDGTAAQVSEVPPQLGEVPYVPTTAERVARFIATPNREDAGALLRATGAALFGHMDYVKATRNLMKPPVATNPTNEGGLGSQVVSGEQSKQELPTHDAIRDEVARMRAARIATATAAKTTKKKRLDDAAALKGLATDAATLESAALGHTTLAYAHAVKYLGHVTRSYLLDALAAASGWVAETAATVQDASLQGRDESVVAADSHERAVEAQLAHARTRAGAAASARNQIQTARSSKAKRSSAPKHA